MLSRLALSISLLTAACTGSDGGPAKSTGDKAEAPSQTEPRGKGYVAVKAEVIAKPGTPDEPGTPDAPAPSDALVGGKAEIRAKVGDTLVETVSNVRNPVDHSSWSAEPKIEGTAVKFLERVVEPPPPDVDGGSNTFRYRFEAVAPGKATVSFALTSPEEAEPIEEVRFRVVVTAG